MKTLSIGKLRGLQQCTSSRRTFTCLALDHRQNLRRALQDLGLMLERLSYSLHADRKLSSEEKKEVVTETARRLVTPGVDVLKAEFPLDPAASPHESAWMEACTGVSAATSAAWILLSAAVDYETYLRQVTVACEDGASGIAVGCAVWQEAVEQRGADRLEFLRTDAGPRLEHLTALCAERGKPWTDFYLSAVVPSDWYASY
jgi:tagatose 1,6-diphosphate aldolase